MSILDVNYAAILVDGLSFALPLLIIAIGGIYSERSGIVNLALEGLLGFGAFVGALFVASTAGLFAAHSDLPMYFSFLFAAIGGGMFAVIHAVLCIKFMANQVISGVVINILSVALTGFFTSTINANFFGQASERFMLQTSPRWDIPFLMDIPILGAAFTRVYPFMLIILVVATFFWYLLYKTQFGMRVRAAGDNPQALDAAGVNVSRVRFGAVVISGVLAGIGGMSFAYSISTNFSPAIYMGFGFLAIAALIFGNWKIIPTFAACLIFGLTRSAAFNLLPVFDASAAVLDLALAAPFVVTLVLLAVFGKKNMAPRALGDVYDKSKR
ncbi:MAG: ABC transporter permease [Coriobacteriia bacterium]|nr:ABC transporter permease [Coriobacteriia bacterium]MCL2536732.1 ABC transporter permease [Coriobacteriia bacterium]